MPPKIEMTLEQIIFINVSNSYAQNKGLNKQDTLPLLFYEKYRKKISYSTLLKYINNNPIDIKYQNEIITSSKNK